MMQLKYVPVSCIIVRTLFRIDVLEVCVCVEFPFAVIVNIIVVIVVRVQTQNHKNTARMCIRVIDVPEWMCVSMT